MSLLLGLTAFGVSFLYYYYRPLVFYLAIPLFSAYLAFKVTCRSLFPVSLNLSLKRLGFLVLVAIEILMIIFHLGLAPEHFLARPLTSIILYNRLFLMALLPNLLLMSALAGAGFHLLRRLRLSFESYLVRVLIGFALGYLLYTSLLLVLLHLRLYTRLSLSLIILTFLIIGLRELKVLLKRLVNCEVRLEKLEFDEVVLGLCFVWVMATAAVTNVRKIPIEPDSFLTYLTNARIVADSGRFLDYPNDPAISYNFEVYLSSLIKLFGLWPANYSSFLFGLLSLGSLLAVSRCLKIRRRDRCLVLALAYLSPIFLTLTLRENKIDPTLTFFSIVCLLCFLHYHQCQERKLLALLGLFLGLSYTVKLTAVFFAVPIFLWELLASIQRRRLSAFLILAVASIVPLLLWWGTSTRLAWLGDYRWSAAKTRIAPLGDGSLEQICRARWTKTDLAIYLNRRSWLDDFLRPFRLLISGLTLDRREASANDLLLLFSLPILCLIGFRRWVKSNPGLSFLAVGSFLTWYFVRWEVLWYGLPVFWLGYLLLAKFLSETALFEGRLWLRNILTFNALVLTVLAVVPYAAWAAFVPYNLAAEEVISYPAFYQGSGERPLSLGLAGFINQTSADYPKARFFLADSNIMLATLFVKDVDRLVYGNLSFFDQRLGNAEKIDLLKTAGFSHLIFSRRKSSYVYAFYCFPDSFEKRQEFMKTSGLTEVFEDNDFKVLRAD